MSFYGKWKGNFSGAWFGVVSAPIPSGQFLPFAPSNRLLVTSPKKRKRTREEEEALILILLEGASDD